MSQNTFSEFLGQVCVVPAYFILPTTPRSVPGCDLGNRATQLWHRTVGVSSSFLFRPAVPPPLGAGGDLGIFWLL